ncbi:MAG TPA: GNAT family N-acetyltransferase [Actinomycetes bacterium]|nr:GNAT family N-acetyltransferase [Actinomycetes bacterium]
MELDDDPARLDVDLVHGWLSAQAYWALGRTRATVARSLAASTVLGAYEDGQLVGLARAVTDGATFAWVCDVFVERAHRGRGIGSALVRELVTRLRDGGVYYVLLATQDAHEVYRRLGFTELAEPSRWMQLDLR